MPATYSSQQISALRSQAQRLDAILKLGKNGITDGFLLSLSTALDQHELIKVKITEHKDQRHALAPQLAEKSGSLLVKLIGNVIVLYRENADPAKRKIKL